MNEVEDAMTSLLMWMNQFTKMSRNNRDTQVAFNCNILLRRGTTVKKVSRQCFSHPNYFDNKSEANSDVIWNITTLLSTFRIRGTKLKYYLKVAAHLNHLDDSHFIIKTTRKIIYHAKSHISYLVSQQNKMLQK